MNDKIKLAVQKYLETKSKLDNEENVASLNSFEIMRLNDDLSKYKNYIVMFVIVEYEEYLENLSKPNT